MTDGEAFSAITGSGSDFAETVALCEALGGYCLIGGLAINCYVEPVYTMDADFVLAADQLQPVRGRLFSAGYTLEDHEWSLNALRSGSRLQMQFTKDPRYAAFPHRAVYRETLGVRLRVACLEDLVQAKVWAWSDPRRRLSKRKKDELDLIRIVENNPEFLPALPASIRDLLG